MGTADDIRKLVENRNKARLGGGEKRIAENKANEFRNLVGDDPFTAQDNDKILELVKK